MERWIITGGAGFVGCNLLSAIAGMENAPRVTVFDSFQSSSFTPTQLTAEFPEIDMTVVDGDVRDLDDLTSASAGASRFIHLAASSDVARSVADPMMDHAINVTGTLNALQAAQANGIGRFVFASSSAPLGASTPPIHEDMPPNLASPYAAGKLAGEGYCQAWAACYAVDTVALRFSNVFGPWSQVATGVVAQFIRAGLESRPIRIYGDGSATRDFVHARDIASAVIAAAQHETALGGDVIHIATHAPTRIGDLAELVNATLADRGITPAAIEYLPERVGDVAHSYSSNARAADVLNWQPKTDLERDVAQTVDWYLAQRR